MPSSLESFGLRQTPPCGFTGGRVAGLARVDRFERGFKTAGAEKFEESAWRNVLGTGGFLLTGCRHPRSPGRLGRAPITMSSRHVRRSGEWFDQHFGLQWIGTDALLHLVGTWRSPRSTPLSPVFEDGGHDERGDGVLRSGVRVECAESLFGARLLAVSTGRPREPRR